MTPPGLFLVAKRLTCPSISIYDTLQGSPGGKGRSQPVGTTSYIACDALLLGCRGGPGCLLRDVQANSSPVQPSSTFPEGEEGSQAMAYPYPPGDWRSGFKPCAACDVRARGRLAVRVSYTGARPHGVAPWS